VISILADLEEEARKVENDINRKTKQLDKLYKTKARTELELKTLDKNPKASFNDVNNLLKSMADDIEPIKELDDTINANQVKCDEKLK